MIALIQRVKKARVLIDNHIYSSINKGMVIFLGIANSDKEQDALFLAEKVINLRIFPDEEGKMNLSNMDIKGEFLVVSQFTLLADCKKGRRPSFEKAAKIEVAEKLYDYFVESLKKSSLNVSTGKFQAKMEVELINDGPVTFILDSESVE